jgi:hypothetical protein
VEGEEPAASGASEEGKGCPAEVPPKAEMPTAESLLYDSFFPAVDGKPVMGPKHPNFTPPAAPSRPFDKPYASSGASSAKRSLSMFRFFS